MKRLISSLVLVLGLSLSSVGNALAAHFWELQMFTPTQAVTSNTFNIEYKVFSVEENDDFTIQLFENNVHKGTQNKTEYPGDSGVFTVNVPGPGTYKYRVTAISSIDGAGNPQSQERTMTVTTTPQGTTTTVFVNNVPDGGGAAVGGAGGGAGGAAPGGAGAPAVAGAQAATGAEGAATTTPGTNGDVLGAEKKDEAKKDSTSGWERAAMIGLPLLALAAAYYFLLHREGKGPLADRLKSKQ